MRTVGLTILSSLIAVFIFVLLTGGDFGETQKEYTRLALPDSPLSASYVHGDTDLRLDNGSYEKDGRSIQTVKGPVYGDINGDGADDAVILLKDKEEYYVALALKDEKGFLGLNTASTGGSVPPQDMYIQDELLHLVYEDSGEEHIRYFTVVGVMLEEFVIDGDLYKGIYVYEGEVLTFKPCNSDETYIISPESNSLAALEAIYTQRSYDRESSNNGVYIVLAGSASSTEESEVNPGNTFRVSSIVRAPKQGACQQSVSEEPVTDVSEQETPDQENAAI